MRDLGPTMAPMNAFLTLTGIETLPLRMRQHNENAEKVAHFLRIIGQSLMFHGLDFQIARITNALKIPYFWSRISIHLCS